VLATLPLFVGTYGVRLATNVLMFVALAQAWNLVGGYTGLLSIAHPAFFGIGAVATAALLVNDVAVPIAVLVATGLSLLVAVVMGWPTLRLRGHYFVIASLLVAEAIRNVVVNMDAYGFSGGVAVNIFTRVPRVPGVEPGTLAFLAMLGLAAGYTALVLGVDPSRWGYALRAIRDDQKAAEALGIDASRVRLAVFAVSAVLTSIVGTAWAFSLGVVDTNEAFSLTIVFEVIVMVFLGGTGTVWGPILGVGVIQLVNEYLGVEFAEYTLMTSGLIVVAIVLFLPDGLVRVLLEGPRTLRPASLRANLRRFALR
jgi:branched-chain amino acid transport system permease protein